MAESQGVIQWIAAYSFAGLLLGSFYLVFFGVMSIPAFLVADATITEAAPFVWIAILALIVNAVQIVKEIDDEKVEKYLDLSRFEQIQVMFIICSIGAFAFSSVTLVSGVGGYLVAESASPVIGIGIAFIYPHIDLHLSDEIGISVMSITIWVSELVLGVLTDLSVLSSRALEIAEDNGLPFTQRRRPPGRTHS